MSMEPSCLDRGHMEAKWGKGWVRETTSKEEAFVVFQGRHEQSLKRGHIKGEG